MFFVRRHSKTNIIYRYMIYSDYSVSYGWRKKASTKCNSLKPSWNHAILLDIDLISSKNRFITELLFLKNLFFPQTFCKKTTPSNQNLPDKPFCSLQNRLGVPGFRFSPHNPPPQHRHRCKLTTRPVSCKRWRHCRDSKLWRVLWKRSFNCKRTLVRFGERWWLRRLLF